MNSSGKAKKQTRESINPRTILSHPFSAFSYGQQDVSKIDVCSFMITTVIMMIPADLALREPGARFLRDSFPVSFRFVPACFPALIRGASGGIGYSTSDKKMEPQKGECHHTYSLEAGSLPTYERQ
jgi:hypothetical protein